MNDSSSHERRGGPRICVDLPVRLELNGGRRATGRMRNASASGALIECAMELPTFTQLRVEILATKDREAVPIQINGRVVRAEHPCIGVEWRDIAPQAYLDLMQASDQHPR